MSEVRACPECDSAQIRHRVTGADTRDRLAEPESDYRCESCEAAFDEPATREPHGGGDTAASVLSRAGFGHLADDAADTGSLSALERDILLVVASLTAAPETPVSVTEAWKQLGQLRDADDCPVHDTVRRHLNRLADAGLISKQTQSRAGNTYQLTAAGRQRLRERERQLSATLQALDMPAGGGADE